MLQERVAIVEADDAGALNEKLLHNGKALIVETLDRLVAGHLSRSEGEDGELSVDSADDGVIVIGILESR